MDQSLIFDTPVIYPTLLEKGKEMGFSMPSDIYIGTLLKTLVGSKPKGSFLELGTGIGLSLAWMIEGMDHGANIISVDNDPELSDLAKLYHGHDSRVQIVCEDGAKWIRDNREKRFDLVFADAWPGKYSDLEAVLQMVRPGGFYVIDDMIEQPNWPEGHYTNAQNLIKILDEDKDFNLTKMNWSTGVLIAVRKIKS